MPNGVLKSPQYAAPVDAPRSPQYAATTDLAKNSHDMSNDVLNSPQYAAFADSASTSHEMQKNGLSDEPPADDARMTAPRSRQYAANADSANKPKDLLSDKSTAGYSVAAP
jgi:hypothetical protein